MPLNKQNVSISFAQGLDTKVDPKQVVPGKLLELENVVFTTGMEFNKRNGYGKLAKLDAGVNLANFKNELVAFDGSALQSYSPSNQTEINKGRITSVDVTTESVFRNGNAQTVPNSAFHSSGVYLYTFTDSVNGNQYILVSSDTGNQVVAATTISANATYVKAWSIGNFLIITYVDTSNNHLKYIALSALTFTATAATDISTLVDGTDRYYEGVVADGNLYLAYNASDVGGAIRVTFIDGQLNQHNTVVQVGEEASQCIGLFADIDLATPQIWVAYYNGSAVKYFVLSSSNLSTILNATTAVTVSNVVNLNGWASNGSGIIYYEVSNTYSYSSTRTDFISKINVTNAGVASGGAVFLRSVGISSKVFIYNDIHYFLVAYNSSLQPTYFVVDEMGLVVSKLAYTNGGGYAPQGQVVNVNSISSTEFEFSYLLKDLLTTQSGNVYTQTGLNSAILDFNANDLYESIDLGNNLNINGGILWAYDGYSPVEQNFNLYPEDFAYTSTSSSTGLFANTYSYIPLYEWTDNQGNIHKSGYGTPLSVPLTTATTGVTVKIPTLRLTAKQNVTISLYRDAPSIATGIYYRVSSITSPTISSTAVDSIQITDKIQDAVLIGNELLYTTGGVVQNTGGPAASGMTTYKNRLMLIDSQDRNKLWYSKQVVEGEPVELSEEFTEFIDPRFGEMTAISVMDDKLIIFKENAIFYQVGNGPDSTGANNDFSEAVFVTSTVGCTNFRSIVLTPPGIMFQSNKGIWLLDRGLNVTYIGAPVEEFNPYNVTSAQLIPNTTQVRFTISNKLALVYDYYFQQWGTFTNHNAAGAVLFSDLYTYITPSGLILQEAPGIYTDNGVPYYMSLSTSWLSLSGFQGFQRAYRLYLKGKFITPHTLSVSVAYDFNDAMTQTVRITPSDLSNDAWGDDPYWGSTQFWGGSSLEEQYRINLIKQKCQSIQISIQEGIDTNDVVYGAGLVLEAIGVLIGAKSTYPRIGANKSVT